MRGTLRRYTAIAVANGFESGRLGVANGFCAARALYGRPRGHDAAGAGAFVACTRYSSSKGVTNGSTAWEDLRAWVVVRSRVTGVEVSGSTRGCWRFGGRATGGLRYCEDVSVGGSSSPGGGRS